MGVRLSLLRERGPNTNLSGVGFVIEDLPVGELEGRGREEDLDEEGERCILFWPPLEGLKAMDELKEGVGYPKQPGIKRW